MAHNPGMAMGEPFHDLRVHAEPDAPGHGHNRPGVEIVCRECGDPFRTDEPHGAFCTNICRQRWNNRRKARGAEIYDLIMGLRFERGLAAKLKLWTAVCRLAAAFRTEDKAERAGRKSWRAPRDVMDERPFLNATVMKAGKPKAEKATP